MNFRVKESCELLMHLMYHIDHPTQRGFTAQDMLRNEPMNEHDQPTIDQAYLTGALDRLEREYHMSSDEFAAARTAGKDLEIHEDDIAEWEYLLMAEAELESYLRESYFRTARDANREDVAAYRHALAA